MTKSSVLAALAILLAALVPATAEAHKASDSYLTLRAHDRELTGQWDIALRDLDFALGLDANGDGAITWGELQAREQAIDAYAMSRLAVSAGGQRCGLAVTQHLVDEHTDGAYAVLALEGRCPAPTARLAIDYRLLFDVDARHRGLLKLEADGTTRTAVFPSDAPVQEFGASNATAASGFTSFVADGVRHIATGFDHILFLVALLLPAVFVRREGRWEPIADAGAAVRHVIAIVTAFTVAHSITLALAAFGVVSLPSRLVESAIAASVLLTALDNLVPFLPRRRWLVAFTFGLLHGMGFASVLIDLQLPTGALAASLVGFNVGVEIGQLALVALVLPLALMARRRTGYRRLALALGSALIAIVSLGWLVERAFVLPFMPV